MQFHSNSLNLKISFDREALILFLVIMCPNIIWVLWPPKDDVMHIVSVTTITDMIGSISQILMLVLLILFPTQVKTSNRYLNMVTLISTCGYLAFWIAYYLGCIQPFVLLMLAVLPCAAFLSYAASRQNWLAFAAAAVFTCCHLTFAVVNFCI